MYMIYGDASCEPFHPGGLLSWAFLVKQGGKIIHQDVCISGWGPEATVNRGEYLAVVGAMYWLMSLPKEKQIAAVIHSDSQLIVNQCKGSWGCRDRKLVPLLELVNRAKERYKKSVIFKWIPREKNTEADELSRSLYTPEALELAKARQFDILFEGDDISW